MHKGYSTGPYKNLNEDRIILGLMKEAEKESSEPASSAFDHLAFADLWQIVFSAWIWTDTALHE